MTTPIVERLVTLFKETASLAEADRWLRDLNYKKLEGKNKAADTLTLVLNLLNEEFLPNNIRADRVDSDGLWLKDSDSNELSWSDMSDGYRAALALLTDILRHMINAYGTDDLTGRDADRHLFIKPGGVVLIDEIDAHLHPEWQREIGFWLKRHFPNIQFIVTSHSPLICQAADPNGLFVLPEPGSDEPARVLTPEEYQEVISSRPDTILRSAAFGLQNTRSPVAVEARSAFADLRTKQRAGGKLTQAELVEMERLRQYINPDEEP
ncbi:AAA family ATPase [Sphaerotilus sp.]|uniref:AAA family ATPase n=1 Tax=Sphaerotilus sp. TaxID=2093942 RepID=UPI002ACD9BD2|nr:AAA family ATPase [Sphaerotilus sp.]MDZ7857058.1 AAA family ATPase [Sphaerotilus sp.]